MTIQWQMLIPEKLQVVIPYIMENLILIRLFAKIILLFLAPFLIIAVFNFLYKRTVSWLLNEKRFHSVTYHDRVIFSAATLFRFIRSIFKLLRIASIVGIYYFFFNWILDLFPGELAEKIISILKGLVLTIITLVAGFFTYRSIRFVFARSREFIKQSRGKYLKDIRFHRVVLVSGEQLGEILTVVLRFVELIAVVFLLYILLPIALSFFDFTRDWAKILFGYVKGPVIVIAGSVIEFIPNLFFILVAVFAGRYVIRFAKFIFNEIGQKRILLSGFEPEWATPSYKITRFLIIVFLAIIIYPYLPGSETEAFKGVSIFLGLLISIGSSTAIANIISGLILTYMLPFRKGDRVSIGDVTGDVIEKSLLVTRIRTIKNVVITIPNSSVLGNSIKNYTTSREHGGLLLNTTITLGYDVPWRKVHRILVEAALDTEGINQEPEPFVLQTSLGDFSVSYELNAYAENPSQMAQTLSDMHGRIQDHCARAGIEILSPHYRTVRNDKSSTIPPVADMVDESEKM